MKNSRRLKKKVSETFACDLLILGVYKGTGTTLAQFEHSHGHKRSPNFTGALGRKVLCMGEQRAEITPHKLKCRAKLKRKHLQKTKRPRNIPPHHKRIK